MEKIPSMVDMARSPQEKAEVVEEMTSPAVSNVPDYPYGLCISLCTEELDKLGLSTEDVEIGDFLHIHALAKVTSVSMRDNEETGKDCRVEMVLAYISAESEDEENQESEPANVKARKMYTSEE